MKRINENRILVAYKNFLAGSETVKINGLIKVTSTPTIKKGELYYKGIYAGYFGVRIAEKNRTIKSKFYRIDILNKQISKNYLIWYLNQKPIQNYLSLFVKGNIIPFLPRKDFLELKIKLPTKKHYPKIPETSIKITSDYRKVLERFYQEYENNKKYNNLFSCGVLAGAICETILLEYLIEAGVKEKLLERKMFGQLIEIAEIKDLDDFPLEDFKKIKKIRNNIHPNVVKGNFLTIDKDIINNLKSFDKIIAHFGI